MLADSIATTLFYAVYPFRRFMPWHVRDHLNGIGAYEGGWRTLRPGSPPITIRQLLSLQALDLHKLLSTKPLIQQPPPPGSKHSPSAAMK